MLVITKTDMRLKKKKEKNEKIREIAKELGIS